LKILIIIPAYNEEGNIGDLLREFKKISSYSFEILVVNDCSKDRTSEISRTFGVNVIDLPCNLGIGGAVQTGYKYALINNFDVAIQVDGDGQHPPEYINNILSPIINGEADMVIGSRYLQKKGFQSTYLRRLGISYFTKLIKLLIGQNITDPTSGYRACNKKVINLFANTYPKDYPEPETIVFLARNKLKIIEVPVLMRERGSGMSSINLAKSVYYMFKVSLAIMIDSLRQTHTNS
jgi:glycosyltransferase involved in cell wall biosynthesis